MIYKYAFLVSVFVSCLGRGLVKFKWLEQDSWDLSRKYIVLQ